MDLRERTRLASLVVTLYAAGAIARLASYGGDVLLGTSLHGVLVLVDVWLLFRVVARAAPSKASSWVTATHALCWLSLSHVLLALFEWHMERTTPGLVYPRVLYRTSPELGWLVIHALESAFLRTASLVLVVLLPRAQRRAEGRRRQLSRLTVQRQEARARSHELPGVLRARLRDVAEDLERAPRRARERLGALADELDAFCRRASMRAPLRGVRASPQPKRHRAAIAVAAIVCVAVPPLAFTLLRDGAVRLPHVALSGLRLLLDLAAGFAVARIGERRRATMASVVLALLVVVALVDLSAVVGRNTLEHFVPGSMYPPSIFTHPTPLGRQVVMAMCSTVQEVAVWALLYLHPLAVDRAERHAERARTLRRDAARARLWSRFEPHFVGNVLNTIASLTVREPGRARDLLMNLEKLVAAACGEQDEHTVAAELDWLTRYAALLQARFPDRLQFHWECDAELAGVWLPRLALQPLLENAVLHGALSSSWGGAIRVEVRAMARGIRCIVEDDGPGLPLGTHHASALGTMLVRERVEAAAGTLRFSRGTHGRGTRAIVELPHRRRAHP